VGPGGINRALRNVPVLVGIGKAMEEHCPDAWLFNITNPMTALTRAVCRETSIKTVGLCHEVGNFCMDLAIALGRPLESVTASVTGVNHFPVLTSLEVDGADGFDVLRGLVDEWAAWRPSPRTPAVPRRHVLQARFCRAASLQTDAARPLGYLPGRRRPAHRRVRLVRAHTRVRVGCGLQH